jgi:dipeptidyl aminopeptidase/acylaminoacyl peptidase
MNDRQGLLAAIARTATMVLTDIALSDRTIAPDCCAPQKSLSTRIIQLLMALATGLCLSLPVLADPQMRDDQAIPVRDSLDVNSFGQLIPFEFSPDAHWLAYTVKRNREAKPLNIETFARTGVRAFYSGTDVFIVNAKTGEAKNLTAGESANWLPTWSPDGKYLAFLSDRDGNSQARVWIWDAVKDSLRRVSDVAVRSDQLEWSPDSSKVFLTVLPEGFSTEEYAKKLLSGTEYQQANATAPGSSVTVYRANLGPEASSKSDPWNLDIMFRDLASVDVTSGEINYLVKGQRITKYEVSPDGSHIGYTSPKRFEKPGSQQILYDLGMITPSTKNVRIAAHSIRLGFDGDFSWSPDGKNLAYRAMGMEEKNNNCYIVTIAGGDPRDVTLLPPQRAGSRMSERALWDAKGEHIFFVNDGALWEAPLDGKKAVEIPPIQGRAVVDMTSQSANVLWQPGDGKSTVVLTHDDGSKQDGFYRLDLSDGGATKLLENGQCYRCVNLLEGQVTAVSQDGHRIAYLAEDAQHDSDLWISSSDFASPKRLTHLNPQFDRYKMGRSQLVDWLADGGERLHGALLLPSDYQEGKQYPLIVLVYGGSLLSNFLDHFGWYCFNLQLFATRGYAVLLPDTPLHLGTPMLDLAKTVLPGINRVIELGIADPNRIGVMGHSYGGYSTLSLIVQSARFKAAMEADGPGDLIGFYGEMGGGGETYGIPILEEGLGLMGGTPWVFRDRYIENSPLIYLDRVETPLLVVQGSNDRATSAFLGDELFVGLRKLGKPVEYARYEGEDHSPEYWTFENQLDFYTRMISWFDKYLKF